MCFRAVVSWRSGTRGCRCHPTGCRRCDSTCGGCRRQGKGVHLLPRVHRVVSLLKRWLLGPHQGAVGPEHLDYYLDEFTFRFNPRKSASRGKLFFRLVQQAVRDQPVPFATLIKPPPVVGDGVKQIPLFQLVFASSISLVEAQTNICGPRR